MSAVESTVGATEVEGVAAAGRRKKPVWVRVLWRCVPRSPKSADGLSNLLTWFAMAAIPLWYVVSFSLGAREPAHPIMWAVPWIIAMYWLGAQMLCLVIASQHSTSEISYWMVFKAMLPPLISLVTMAVFVVLWILHKYNFGVFQWDTFAAFFSASAFNAVIGGGMRFALKGKLFGQLGQDN